MINAPSSANSDLLNLDVDLQQLSSGGACAVHVDIMDGHYVPNLTFPPSLVGSIKREHPDLVVDAHLMVSNVAQWTPQLNAHGCDAVGFGLDSTYDPDLDRRQGVKRFDQYMDNAGFAHDPAQLEQLRRRFPPDQPHTRCLATSTGPRSN